MQEDVILTTALTVKKYTPAEQELMQELTKSKANIEVLIPEDLDQDKFDLAISAVSKVIAKATLQREAMFPVLGRLLWVAKQHEELWNKKFADFDAFRGSLSDRFGLGRSTSFDALKYAERWYVTLPPSEFSAVGRVKLKMIESAIGKGDEGKATARKIIEFAKEHTAAELEEKLDKDFHVSRGTSSGAKFVIPSNKKQAKEFTAWFNDARVQAYCESGKSADVLGCMIAECSAEWFDKGQQMIDAAQEAAQQAEKENAAADSAA